MAQTEAIDKFRRFQAARTTARIETDRAYTRPTGMHMTTSGTAIVAKQTVLEKTETDYLPQSARGYAFDETTSITIAIVHRGNRPSDASDSLIVRNSHANPTGNTAPHIEFGNAADSSEELDAVTRYARKQGLEAVADRLAEMSRRPLDKDEAPLHADSARSFVDYCIARQKHGRPLMTDTPSGELDATWKGPDREKITMRFFPNGSVWIAYKLSKEKGSFEAAAIDLPDPHLHFKLPHWA